MSISLATDTRGPILRLRDCGEGLFYQIRWKVAPIFGFSSRINKWHLEAVTWKGIQSEFWEGMTDTGGWGEAGA